MLTTKSPYALGLYALGTEYTRGGLRVKIHRIKFFN